MPALPLMMVQESAMAQRMPKTENESGTYQICLIDDAGVTTLIFKTMCDDYDEAVGKLLAIENVSHSRFEISRGGALISSGSRCN
jgi:hypothetical protein